MGSPPAKAASDEVGGLLSAEAWRDIADAAERILRQPKAAELSDFEADRPSVWCRNRKEEGLAALALRHSFWVADFESVAFEVLRKMLVFLRHR
jgi:hypothetical protein